MSACVADEHRLEATEREAGPPTDSLRMGILLLVGMTVVQKLVGFVRNVLFCRWLEPHQIGYWELALSFFILASPLVVGGLPGAFGRYTEFFRQRGQLRKFISRMTLVSAALMLSGVALMLLFPRRLAWLVFEDAQLASLAITAAISLIAVVAYNYVVILLESLRQPRWATIARFSHASMFALLGLLGLVLWQPGVQSIVIAYGIASLLASAFVVTVLVRLFRKAPADVSQLGNRDLWSKMAPAAGCIWTVNLLTNLFSLVDRWMIVHMSGLEPQAAAGLVGQFHSSQALPVLIVGVVLSFDNMLMPYLSCDWDTGRKAKANRTLKTALVGITVFAMSCAVVLLVGAPLMFDWLLQGRYEAGSNILPWALLAAVSTCSFIVAQNYLWCIERPRWVNVTLAVGLIGNIALNAILLPVWGLAGAAIATAAANLLALATLLWINHRFGMRFDIAMAAVLFAPLTLCLGAWAAAVTLAALAAYEWKWGGLLFERGSDNLARIWTTLLNRFRRLRLTST